MLAEACHQVGFHELAVLPDAARVLAVHAHEWADGGQECCAVVSPRLARVKDFQRVFVPLGVAGDDTLSCLPVVLHAGGLDGLFDEVQFHRDSCSGWL